MSPDPATRHRMLDNIALALRPAGGMLLLVVPASESVQIVRRRQGEWLRRCAAAGLEAVPLDDAGQRDRL